MQDRVPTYPGRVKLTPVPWQDGFYDLERADDPVVDGTPINKATLLTDATAALLALTGNPTVNDALAKIASGKIEMATGSYIGNGNYGQAHPCVLNFSFTPYLVIVFEADMGFLTGESGESEKSYTLIAVNPADSASRYGNTKSAYEGNIYDHFTWGDRSFNWYSYAQGSTDGTAQLNASGATYYYFALGVI